MKILITGGAGFVGSAVVRQLIGGTEHSVVNVDRLTYAGNLANVKSVSGSQRYAFEKIDICDRSELNRVFSQWQPDAVMHLAAESHVDRSIDDPSEFIQTNVIGTFNLLEASRCYCDKLTGSRRESFRFHHVSTDEVYGDLPHPRDDERAGDVRFTETTAYAPSSPYSASKASSDHLVRSWHRTYGMPIVITNCSNNYGPFHFPEKLVPHIILRCIQQKTLPVYGNGEQIRDWLYVEDHANALCRVLFEGSIGETYNIGGHNEKTNLDVVRSICDIMDEEYPIMKGGCDSYRDLITHVSDRPGHDRRYSIDPSKIQKELGWTPKETFETGLRKTVRWYLDNLSWCQSVLDSNYKLKRLGRKKVAVTL